MIYRIVWSLCGLVFQVLLRRRIRGTHHVPRRGAVILASNHISNLDPPMVATSIWRPAAFMAKEELFENKFFGWFIRQLHAFPVKRGSGDRAALKKSLEILDSGWPLVMFPEGTRSETGEMKEPEMGVAMIAYRTGVPVVPVYIHGTNRVWPKGGGIKLAQVGIVYGEPMVFTVPEGQKAGRDDYERAAHRIMDEIRRLRDAQGWK